MLNICKLTLGIKLNPRNTLMLINTMRAQILSSKLRLSLTIGSIIQVAISTNVEKYNVVGMYFESLRTSTSTFLVKKIKTNPII